MPLITRGNAQTAKPSKHNIYTTGAVGEICGHSTHMITTLINEGKLRGYSLPGKKDKRVTHPVLVDFMERIGMILDREVLILSDTAARGQQISDAMQAEGLDPLAVLSMFALGRAMRNVTKAVIIDDYRASKKLPKLECVVALLYPDDYKFQFVGNIEKNTSCDLGLLAKEVKERSGG